MCRESWLVGSRSGSATGDCLSVRGVPCLWSGRPVVGTGTGVLEDVVTWVLFDSGRAGSESRNESLGPVGDGR